MLIARQLEDVQGARPRRARRSATALSSGARRLEGVDVVVCPPFVSLAAPCASLDAAAASRLRAERPLGSRGRVHRRGLGARCSSSSASTGALVGHSERRQLLRRDRRDGRAPRARPRSRPGSRVIACVGETLRRARGRRDRGSCSRPGRGDRRRCRRARAARDRLRAGLGDRHRQDGDAGAWRRRRTRSSSRCSTRRCSTAARSSPRTPPSSSSQPRRRRRARRRRLARRSTRSRRFARGARSTRS